MRIIKDYKYIGLFAVVSIFSSTAFYNNNFLLESAKISEDYENRFFALDFENDSFDISDFKEHFFTTFPHNDPTLGDVVYDRTRWIHDGIIDFRKGEGLYSYLKFRDEKSGFDSFRFTTKSFFNLSDDETILFVFKGELPSANGIWPAWWLNGSKEDTWIYKDNTIPVTDESLDRYSGIGEYYDTPSAVNPTDWPGAGEIDIIENINGQDSIHNTIHTCPQMCDSEWNDSGEIINCANAKTGDVNAGCSGKAYSVDNVKGTFACMWAKDTIHFYYWNPRSDVRKIGGPLSAYPNPEEWNKTNLMNRVKLLETDAVCDDNIHQSWQCSNCEISNTCSFINMKMIFNVTLCGVWAGNTFDSTDSAFENCKQYISNEGKSDIHNQYMKIEYVSVNRL